MFPVSLIGTYLFHLFIIERIMRMKNLNKELKNFEPPIRYKLNKKPQLWALECPKELS